MKTAASKARRAFLEDIANQETCMKSVLEIAGKALEGTLHQNDRATSKCNKVPEVLLASLGDEVEEFNKADSFVLMMAMNQETASQD